MGIVFRLKPHLTPPAYGHVITEIQKQLLVAPVIVYVIETTVHTTLPLHVQGQEVGGVVTVTRGLPLPFKPVLVTSGAVLMPPAEMYMLTIAIISNLPPFMLTT